MIGVKMCAMIEKLYMVVQLDKLVQSMRELVGCDDNMDLIRERAVY